MQDKTKLFCFLTLDFDLLLCWKIHLVSFTNASVVSLWMCEKLCGWPWWKPSGAWNRKSSSCSLCFSGSSLPRLVCLHVDHLQCFAAVSNFFWCLQWTQHTVRDKTRWASKPVVFVVNWFHALSTKGLISSYESVSSHLSLDSHHLLLYPLLPSWKNFEVSLFSLTSQQSSCITGKRHWKQQFNVWLDLLQQFEGGFKLWTWNKWFDFSIPELSMQEASLQFLSLLWQDTRCTAIVSACSGKHCTSFWHGDGQQESQTL